MTEFVQFGVSMIVRTSDIGYATVTGRVLTLSLRGAAQTNVINFDTDTIAQEAYKLVVDALTKS